MPDCLHPLNRLRSDDKWPMHVICTACLTAFDRDHLAAHGAHVGELILALAGNAKAPTTPLSDWLAGDGWTAEDAMIQAGRDDDQDDFDPRWGRPSSARARRAA